MHSIDTDIDELTKALEDTLNEEPPSVIVYNDDVNTFEWVIENLIKYCGHSKQQAEQSATLIHYKGSCKVLSGNIDVLRLAKENLCDAGIDAAII